MRHIPACMLLSVICATRSHTSAFNSIQRVTMSCGCAPSSARLATVARKAVISTDLKQEPRFTSTRLRDLRYTIARCSASSPAHHVNNLLQPTKVHLRYDTRHHGVITYVPAAPDSHRRHIGRLQKVFDMRSCYNCNIYHYYRHMTFSVERLYGDDDRCAPSLIGFLKLWNRGSSSLSISIAMVDEPNRYRRVWCSSQHRTASISSSRTSGTRASVTRQRRKSTSSSTMTAASLAASASDSKRSSTPAAPPALVRAASTATASSASTSIACCNSDTPGVTLAHERPIVCDIGYLPAVFIKLRFAAGAPSSAYLYVHSSVSLALLPYRAYSLACSHVRYA